MSRRLLLHVRRSQFIVVLLHLTLVNQKIFTTQPSAPKETLYGIERQFDV